ncbi:MAG TPA: choice-of-anchor Q domain-containing protein [Thermoleophilaceae bacterium]
MTRTRIALAAATLAASLLGSVGVADASAQGGLAFDPCEPSCDVLVETVVDAPDAEPGDGECASAAGECTLRAAVQELNATRQAFPDPYYKRIVLPPGRYVLTHHGAGENESATGDLDPKFVGSIIGSGVGKTVVDGDRADRVFAPTEYGFELAHLTVRGGRVVGPGGGILSRTQLYLHHLEVTDNEAVDGVDTADPPPGSHWGESLPGHGGGIDAHDTSVTDVHVHHNTADYGGGMQWHGQQAGFGRVTLDHNHARVSGGGLRFPAFDAGFGLLTVTDNSAGVRGGGIEVLGPGTFWALNMGGSTIADNAAPEGGGMWLSEQPADEPGARVHAGLLVTGNQGGDCAGPTLFRPADSKGGNADSDGTCGFGGPDDASGIDAELGPLADNGGPTPTRALLAGSEAIDAWSCTFAKATDQRGAPRPTGTACDSGAFEVGPCCPAYETPSFEAPRGTDPPGPPNPPGPNPPGPGPNPNPPGPNPPVIGACGVRQLGTAKADRLHGDESRNDIAGRSGADTILGLGGDDCLFGNAGDDVLKGGAGADRLEGGSGHDRLVSGDGNDAVDAGPGNDVVDSRGKGRDRIDCGPGRDKALVGDLDRVRNCERVVNVD